MGALMLRSIRVSAAGSVCANGARAVRFVLLAIGVLAALAGRAHAADCVNDGIFPVCANSITGISGATVTGGTAGSDVTINVTGYSSSSMTINSVRMANVSASVIASTGT